MKTVFIFFICLVTCKLFAQDYQYVYRNSADSSFNSYLVFEPKVQAKGLIIRDYSRLPDASKKSRFHFKDLAVEDGYVYLITCTSNNFPELYFFKEPMLLLDEMVAEVVQKYQIPSDKIFMGGMSSSGTRAMRFAAYCNSGQSDYGTRISAVFACDSPLDNERFYNSAVKILNRNHPKGMNDEATWMKKKFEVLGNPKDNYDQYLRSSVVLRSSSSLEPLEVYKNLPIRLYFEADMDWWLNERNASFEDINAIDHVAFAEQMNQLGDSKVELIQTCGKGYDAKGERNCHSWSIVDEAELLEWLNSI